MDDRKKAQVVLDKQRELNEEEMEDVAGSNDIPSGMVIRATCPSCGFTRAEVVYRQMYGALEGMKANRKCLNCNFYFWV